MPAPYTRILSLGNHSARPALPARIRDAIAACSPFHPFFSAGAMPRQGYAERGQPRVGGGIYGVYMLKENGLTCKRQTVF